MLDISSSWGTITTLSGFLRGVLNEVACTGKASVMGDQHSKVISGDQNLGAEAGTLGPPDRQEGAARWAALVGDKLVPMPRRRLAVADILFQATAASNLILVRDFNSPHDVGFTPSAMIDLAEGNVFRLVPACTQQDAVRPDAAPKLAFVVDDRCEIVIRGMQTVASLRGLFDLDDDVDLLRDYESPRDELLDDDDNVRFADGPVFITRTGTERMVRIIVNARPREWRGATMSFEQVLPLAFNPVRTEPFILYTVMYSRGPKANPEGELVAGGSVRIKDRMVFLVTETDRS